MEHENRRKSLVLASLMFILWVTPSHSFPAYLLTRSNCWTQLSTEEVMMNKPVVAAADSDDPAMKIQIVTETDTQVILSVKTTNAQTNPDYHFVIDVIDGECSFVSGSCDDEKRIIGRAHGTVELEKKTISSSCVVVAGWAAGYEAVRLTPQLHIGSVVAKETVQEVDHKKVEVVQKEEAPVAAHEEEVKSAPHKEVHEPILEKSPASVKVADPQRALDAKHHVENQLHDQINHNWRAEVKEEKKHRRENIQRIQKERLEHNMHKNLLKYEIGFDAVGISWSGYVQGAVFLIGASFIFVVVSLTLSESASKGRRSL